jgi:hypothetical protein
MALRKSTKKEYPAVFSDYNNTPASNPSHLVDDNTNFNLRPITLENIDEVVWSAFNTRFNIGGKYITLIPLDADVASLKFQNPLQFNEKKGYLNLPYFTMWRSSTAPMTRTSPTNKPIIYAIPKQKPQGVVYEEWIMPPPQMLKVNYTFKFVTSFREHLNQFEQYMLEYFKNKRNILILDNERFEIQPSNLEQISSIEVADKEGSVGQSLYIATYELFVTAYLRDISQIQKRERPNIMSLQIVERSGPILSSINQTETRLPRSGIDRNEI